MSSTVNWITSSSSVLIRVLCYVFFRWIPGHHIPILLSSLVPVYAISYWTGFSKTPTFDVLEGDTSIHITTTIEPSRYSDHSSETSTPSGETDELIVEEELDVEESLLVEQKQSNILRSLLIGTPTPYWLQSILAFAINTILVLGVVDLTYRGPIFYDSQELSFARVGYVSDTAAKILVREPDANQLPLYLSYRYADASGLSADRQNFEGAWRSAGYVRSLNTATDFTTTFIVGDLEPDTRYQYALSNNHSGHFITAPLVGKISERSTANEKFTFLHTSCVKPHFPYNPLDHPLSIRGFRLLSPWLRKLRPAFMMFLGDFIYIDVPRRLGDDRSTYRREYRQIYNSPDWPSVASTGPTAESFASYDIPWLHVYDDHEIENDWAQNTTGVFPAAFDPFSHYQLAPNPPYPKNKGYMYNVPHLPSNPTYTSFTQGPASFFLMDTRRYRDPPNYKDPYDWRVTMLGVQQRTALLEWLREPVPPGVFWKIVISSVPFTKNWRVNSADGWAGYLYERQAILEEMWRVSSTAKRTSSSGQDAPPAPRVIILSGDRHEFAATAFPAPPAMTHPKSATVYEFSVSPLSMFYLPFRTYWENHKEKRVEDAWSRDICLKYLPEGNSKFGAIEIEKPTGSGQSLLRYRLFVEGKETWSYVITAGGADENDKGRWKEGLWG